MFYLVSTCYVHFQFTESIYCNGKVVYNVEFVKHFDQQMMNPAPYI